MKKFRKLIPALCLLLVSAMLLGTSTFAWFSMNNKVTVTGMEVKTKVSSNLLISAWDDGQANNGNSDVLYGSKITQIVKGILEPTSTIDAKTFYYANTTEVVADGSIKSGATWIPYSSSAEATGSDASKYADAFSQNYDVTMSDAEFNDGYLVSDDGAQPYVDYVFFLKATNTESVPSKIVMSKCNLLYSNDAGSSAVLNSDSIKSSGISSNMGKAWRVALIVTDTSKDTDPTTEGTLKTILALDGASYFEGSSAVASSSATNTVNNYANEAIVATLAGGSTAYYKVVVRMWLEGEDKSCNNDTYAVLNNEYTLDLEFQIAKDAQGVKNISSLVWDPTK